jgi:hypothetical protein
MKGLGSAFQELIQGRMSASSAVTLRWAERRLRLVSSANQRSTRLRQEALVGVKRTWEPGVAQQPFLDRGSFVGGVVLADQVQVTCLLGHPGAAGVGGEVVTPRRWTRRVACSTTNNTYSRDGARR